MEKQFFLQRNCFLLKKNSLFQRKIIYFNDFLSELAFSVVLDCRISIFSGSWISELAFQWFLVVGISIFSGLGCRKCFGISIFSCGFCGISIFSGHFSLFIRFQHNLGAISSLILSQCQFGGQFLLRNESCQFFKFWFGVALILALALALAFALALALLLFGLFFPGLAWPGLVWLGFSWLGLAWPGLAWFCQLPI